MPHKSNDLNHRFNILHLYWLRNHPVWAPTVHPWRELSHICSKLHPGVGTASASAQKNWSSWDPATSCLCHWSSSLLWDSLGPFTYSWPTFDPCWQSICFDRPTRSEQGREQLQADSSQQKLVAHLPAFAVAACACGGKPGFAQIGDSQSRVAFQTIPRRTKCVLLCLAWTCVCELCFNEKPDLTKHLIMKNYSRKMFGNLNYIVYSVEYCCCMSRRIFTFNMFVPCQSHVGLYQIISYEDMNEHEQLLHIWYVICAMIYAIIVKNSKKKQGGYCGSYNLTQSRHFPIVGSNLSHSPISDWSAAAGPCKYMTCSIAI